MMPRMKEHVVGRWSGVYKRKICQRKAIEQTDKGNFQLQAATRHRPSPPHVDAGSGLTSAICDTVSNAPNVGGTKGVIAEQRTKYRSHRRQENRADDWQFLSTLTSSYEFMCDEKEINQ